MGKNASEAGARTGGARLILDDTSGNTNLEHNALLTIVWLYRIGGTDSQELQYFLHEIPVAGSGNGALAKFWR